MKKKLLLAQENVDSAYREFLRNPDSVAPQFRDLFLSKLAEANAILLQATDAVVESEQLDGGLN